MRSNRQAPEHIDLPAAGGVFTVACREKRMRPRRRATHCARCVYPTRWNQIGGHDQGFFGSRGKSGTATDPGEFALAVPRAICEIARSVAQTVADSLR